jgi:hypothetical protein
MRLRMLGSSIAVALTVGLCATLAAASPQHLSARAQWRANRHHAARLAILDLGAVRLQQGSRRVRRLAPFKNPASEEAKLGSTLEIVRRRFWVVPARPAAVIRFAQKGDKGRFHAPRGGGRFDSGFFDDEPEPEFDTIESNRRERRGVVESTTTVTVTPLRHGRSGVEVESVAVPVRPRSAGERVPGGVDRVRVGITTWRGEKRSLVIRAQPRVSSLSRLANRLRIDQGPALCEEALAEVGTPQPPVVRLSFESAAGRVLAEASQRAGAVGCSSMRFVVDGKRMRPLQNGAALLRAVLPERRRLAQQKSSRPANWRPHV